MRHIVLAALWLVASAAAGVAQIPRLPIARPGVQPVRHDSLHDSVLVRWPTPDSVTAALLAKQGYTVTQYTGDTAFFNTQRHSLDLLAAGKRKAIVERDSEIVVSDSGIYYTEATHSITTGGHYRIRPPPSSGQADIVASSPGRVQYNLNASTLRITNAKLPVNNGDMWFMQVSVAEVQNDTSANGKRSPTVWVGGGTLTSCDDSIPDYQFVYKEAKRTSSNGLFARPAILYIKDIPVMWFPFMFSDTRPGRHSGILAPQFGLGDIVRNSPTYRRHVDHAGYYWALNDYMDFSTWIDWRSSAGAVANDPGWIKFNGDWDYKWIDRFLSGRIGTSYTEDGNGSKNLAVTWNHQQDLTPNSHITTSVNYVTNTTLQRQNTFNPYAALATIASQAAYSSKAGPLTLNLGATRKQYPGRQQVEQTFPTLNITSTPISLGKFFSWTPGFSFNRSDVLHIDQPGLGAEVFSVNPTTGRLDSTQANNRNSATTSLSFDSPIQIFGWDLKNSFKVNQQRNNFPQEFTIYDVETGAVTDTRVFAATYNTNIDWTPDFTLPSLGHNRFNLTPSISLGNVDPSPFWVASERTNGRFVHQAKRITGSLSASPTIFGLFPGFGPFTRIRHSISPTFGYSWAPGGNVSDEYLIALGRTRKGYLGDLPQSSINFGLTQVIQAKIRSKNDSTPDAGTPIDLLALTFMPLTYDFERAKEFAKTHGHAGYAGISTEGWGYSVRSGLLPGFDFSTQYSLFQGSTLSDTAKFSPYLTGISASFNVSRTDNPFVAFARLFGKAAPPAPQLGATTTDQVRPRSDDAMTQALAAQPVAGQPVSGDRFLVPPSNGWRASISLTRSSPRPLKGPNVVSFDPKQRCQQIAGGNPLVLDTCLADQTAHPTNGDPVTSATAGGPQYNIPATTSIVSDLGFSLTPKWTAHWNTTYDLEHHQFATHIVQLQRELHDWHADFGFTQSPNGNFAFTFMIALKAEPDLKFDYNRATVRNGIVPF